VSASHLLHEDPWIELHHLRSDSIVIFRRTDQPFTDLAAAAATLRDVESKVTALGRVRGILVDTRRAPMRNDPEFERVSQRGFQRILDHFERVAVIVSTAVGQLQTQRIKRENALDYEVFTDEAQALRFLRG
jgi:hypothetical protein